MLISAVSLSADYDQLYILVTYYDKMVKHDVVSFDAYMAYILFQCC